MNQAEVATIVDDARENWADTPWLIEWLIKALKETPMQPGEDKDAFISSRGLIADDPRVASLFRNIQDEERADEALLAVEDDDWPIELPSPAASSPRSLHGISGEADLTSLADDRFGSPTPEPTSANPRELAPVAVTSTVSLPSPPLSTAPAPPNLTAATATATASLNSLLVSSVASKPSSNGGGVTRPSKSALGAATTVNGRPTTAPASAGPSPPASRPTSPKVSTSTNKPSAIKEGASTDPPRVQIDGSSPASSATAGAPSSTSSLSQPLSKVEQLAFSPVEYDNIIKPLLANTRSFVATPKDLIQGFFPRRLATPANQRKAMLGSLHSSVKPDSKFWRTWSEFDEGFIILDDWLEAAIAPHGSPESINGEGTAELVMQTLNALTWDPPSIKKYTRIVKNVKRVKENAKGRFSSSTVGHAVELLGAMDRILPPVGPKSGDKKRKNTQPTAQEPPKKSKPSSPAGPLKSEKSSTSTTTSSSTAPAMPSFKKRVSAMDAAILPVPAKLGTSISIKPKNNVEASSVSSKVASSSSSGKPSSAPVASTVPTTAKSVGPVRKVSLSKESSAPAPVKHSAAVSSSGASQAFTKKPQGPQLSFTKKPPSASAAVSGPTASGPAVSAAKLATKTGPTASGRQPVPARNNSGPPPNPFESALSLRVGGGTTPPPPPAPGAVKVEGSLKRKHSDTGAQAKTKKRVTFAPDEILEDCRVFAWRSPEPEDRENVHPRPSGTHHDLHSLDTGEGGAYKVSQDLNEGSALVKVFGAGLDESDWYPPLALELPPAVPYEGTLVAADRERESRIPPASYFTAADVPPNPSEDGIATVADSAETPRFAYNEKEDPPEPELAASILPSTYNPNIANALNEEQLRQLVASASASAPSLMPAPHQQPPAPPSHNFYQPPAPSMPPPVQQPFHAVAQPGGYSPHASSYGQPQHPYHQQSPPHAPYGGSVAHHSLGAGSPSYGQHAGRPQGPVFLSQAAPQATPWATSQPQHHQGQDSGLVDPDSGPYGYQPVHSGFQPPPPTYPDRPTFNEPYRVPYRGGGGGGRGRGNFRGRGRGGGWY